MGFAADSNGTTDTLYVAPSAAGVLGTIGIPAFNTAVVGSLPLQDSELTGTGDGRLFAFYSAPNSMAIAQLNRVERDRPFEHQPAERAARRRVGLRVLGRRLLPVHGAERDVAGNTLPAERQVGGGGGDFAGHDRGRRRVDVRSAALSARAVHP